ncbi:acetyl-CoA carboxylase, carboxyltransferase subunit beta [Verrucomicrobia bacterium]|nr:acetyl-CoA carboxylase, carboxyltransferase subunit beta [Verrucomicrobiota bacterium]
MATTILSKKISGLDVVEPALTPPSEDTETKFLKKPILGDKGGKRKDIPEGLWKQCPKCGSMLYDKELDENLKVCRNCDHHFPISSKRRIDSLVEKGTFKETNSGMTSVDTLKFNGVSSYESKLSKYRDSTGLKDAVVTGTAIIGTHNVALGVMDFTFLGGSMGSVVGEKLARLIELGTEKGLPVIIISASGGARMYEGMLSLMQMAKTCGALAYLAKKKIPYISILTHPTTAGVMASYASVGDLIIAEPGAMIGFAGPRVIKDTTQAELPPGFQTAEFLIQHGLIDSIVPRSELKKRLTQYLDYMNNN